MRRILVLASAAVLCLATAASAGPLHADPDDTPSRVDIATAKMEAVPGVPHRRLVVVTTYDDMRLRAGTRRITLYLDLRRGPGFDVAVTVEYDGGSSGLGCFVGTRGTPDPPFEPRRCDIGARRIAVAFDVRPHKRIRWRVQAAEGQPGLTSMVTVDRAPDAGWYVGPV
jgi:hypothetical protein